MNADDAFRSKRIFYLAHAIMQEAQDEEQGKGNDKGICKPWRKACEMNQPFEKYINCQAGKRYC